MRNPEAPLRAYRISVALAYTFATALALWLLTLEEARTNTTALLSTTALFATLGSALCTLLMLWHNDFLARLHLDVDILQVDIVKSSPKWRRWPFLGRREHMTLLTGDHIVTTLDNPRLPIEVGSHRIEIDVPTTTLDLFDLPVWHNWWLLRRFQSHIVTKQFAELPERSPLEVYQTYACLRDIWNCALGFRLTRLAIHFCVGLVVAALLVLLSLLATS